MPFLVAVCPVRDGPKTRAVLNRGGFDAEWVYGTIGEA